ncbi:MAG: hypothetical protein D6736_07690 [Nitrospinota bacterium]|nr:MAG: hypothetical protein D6736_07690 [Nitrospinota bacterium]
MLPIGNLPASPPLFSPKKSLPCRTRDQKPSRLSKTPMAENPYQWRLSGVVFPGRDMKKGAYDSGLWHW